MAESIVVPAALAAAHERHSGAAGLAWASALPALAATFIDRWSLRLDAGQPMHGQVSLILPVIMADDTPAMLKLQPLDEETKGEAVGLRGWNGQGAVRLIEDDPATSTLLLERLSASRSLAAVPSDVDAAETIATILARLTAYEAPVGLRRLSDIGAAMLLSVPSAKVFYPGAERLLATCAGWVRDLLPEAGNRLLHWDLHYENVLAGTREPWLAIDPKPLAGDPGFELMPALHNRWDEVVASGDIGRAVRRRFDVMVEVLGLDRDRAVGWTLGRVLQNVLWDAEDGEPLDPVQVAVAEALYPSLGE